MVQIRDPGFDIFGGVPHQESRHANPQQYGELLLLLELLFLLVVLLPLLLSFALLLLLLLLLYGVVCLFSSAGFVVVAARKIGDYLRIYLPTLDASTGEQFIQLCTMLRYATYAVLRYFALSNGNIAGEQMIPACCRRVLIFFVRV